MTGGKYSPDQLHASVYGQEVNDRLASEQRKDLEKFLAQALDRGNLDEIAEAEEQLRRLGEATDK